MEGEIRMHNFCSQCGQKLDQKTGLCPQCNREVLVKESKQRKLMIAAIIILCCISLAAIGVIVALLSTAEKPNLSPADPIIATGAPDSIPTEPFTAPAETFVAATEPEEETFVAVTEPEVETSVAVTEPEVEITQPKPETETKDPTELLKNFIASKAYRTYVTSDQVVLDELQYVIYDLNADGTPELLIQCTMDSPFFFTWLFAVKNQAVVLINEDYGYGQYRYSPSQNAVIGSPEFKPFGGMGYSPFYRLSGTNFEHAFDIVIDQGSYYYNSDNTKKELTEQERAAYFDDAVWFDWSDMDSL